MDHAYNIGRRRWAGKFDTNITSNSGVETPSADLADPQPRPVLPPTTVTIRRNTTKNSTKKKKTHPSITGHTQTQPQIVVIGSTRERREKGKRIVYRPGGGGASKKKYAPSHTAHLHAAPPRLLGRNGVLGILGLDAAPLLGIAAPQEGLPIPLLRLDLFGLRVPHPTEGA